MTKHYIFCEPAGRSSDPIWLIYSEDAIISEYWESWKKKGIQYNRAHNKPDNEGLDPNRCIEDWVVVHWAVEATPENLLRIIGAPKQQNSTG